MKDYASDLARDPREVKKRPIPGGKKADYITHWSLVQDLNDTFGPLGWSSEILRELSFPLGDNTWCCQVIARLDLHPEGSVVCSHASVGTDIASTPVAVAMSIKAAETDALKRAAHWLGRRFGLDLYPHDELATDEKVNTETGEITRVLVQAQVPAKPNSHWLTQDLVTELRQFQDTDTLPGTLASKLHTAACGRIEPVKVRAAWTTAGVVPEKPPTLAQARAFVAALSKP